MKKINIGLVLFNVVIAFYLLHMLVEQNKDHKHTVHPYDYVIEIDATDSIETVHIFDNRHYSVGSFTTAHPDSLQIIIDQDNL